MHRASYHLSRTQSGFWLLGLLFVFSCCCSTGDARLQRKVHATLAYTLEGRQTVIGAGGSPGVFDVGGQVLLYHTLKDQQSGAQLGHMAGHCHIVSKSGESSFVAVCTKHFDFADGSTMTAHATETVGPDNKPISARMVVAGGIGRWEGAHGEDLSFLYDPKQGRGSGKIVLTCLKGVC